MQKKELKPPRIGLCGQSGLESPGSVLPERERLQLRNSLGMGAMHVCPSWFLSNRRQVFSSHKGFRKIVKRDKVLASSFTGEGLSSLFPLWSAAPTSGPATTSPSNCCGIPDRRGP